MGMMSCNGGLVWGAVSHHHVRINVTRALSVVYHIMLSIFAEPLQHFELLKIFIALSLFSLSIPVWVVVMLVPY